MANENENIKTNSFDRGEQSDIKNFHSPPGKTTHVRNGINSSKTGDIFEVGSEPANVLQVKAPYTIIGFIYLFADTWAVFSTNDTDSEIGRYVESTQTYTTVVNDSYYTSQYKKLGLSRANLITGASKENFDCSWWIYWQDGLNPDRMMNFDSPPFIQTCNIVNNCQICTPVLIGGKPVLDVDGIRLARLVNFPCLQVKQGASGGNLLNGSYMVTSAYLFNGQKVTDYFLPSNVQPLFQHSNVAGSIDVIVDNADQRFDEFELIVISVVNNQTQAKRFGVYSTRQKQISIDYINPELPDVPLEQIPVHNPIADKSDGMFPVGNYLVRVGPTNKFDFNYQPLANQIVTKWNSVEYPADYYRKGGSNAGRLRDENYCEFIQWVYDDGDLSSSFHIPGRPAVIFPLTGTLETAPLGGSSDSLDPTDRVFEVFNTAQLSGLTTTIPTGDGGFIIQEGYMGYWESTELYPDDKPDVWNASVHPWSQITSIPYAGTALSDYDLCGKPIRHHKMPEQRLSSNLVHFVESSPNFNGQPAIRIIATKYENILPPRDNNGNLIPGIVGYRILRGTREGNKTVVAKGMINNMTSYIIQGTNGTQRGLYPNYPYNALGQDPFIATADTSENLTTGQINGYGPSLLNGRPTQSFFTFHSPDTQFRQPFLSMKELKIYGQIEGDVLGNFLEPLKHPKHKFVTDLAFVSAVIAGVGIAVLASNGQRTTTRLLPRKVGTLDSGFYTEVNTAGAGLWSLDNPTTPAAAIASDILLGLDVAAAEGFITASNAGAQATTTALLGFKPDFPGIGLYDKIRFAYATSSADPSIEGFTETIQSTDGDNVPDFLRGFPRSIPAFVNYWSQGVDATLDLIRALLRWNQHALQYQSHCLYNRWQNSVIGNTRSGLQTEIYLDNQFQDFVPGFKVNNLYRGKSVALQTLKNISDPVSTGTAPFGDNSKQTLTTLQVSGVSNPPSFQSPAENAVINYQTPFTTQAISHYAALKNELKAQYGQIGGVRQIPLHSCTIDTTQASAPYSTGVLFGGDTYIGRYTEKNTMFFFYDWLYDQPNGYEFNYRLKQYIPHPMYWMDTHKWDIAEVVSGLGTAFTTGQWQGLLPQSLHAFDSNGVRGFFGRKDAYIYLSNSGVRDLYVESEVLTDFRDWGEDITERYYDPYRFNDLSALFDLKPEVLKSGNYFKYDYSLSVSKLFNQLISWANVQPINYDPNVYATCFVHNPNLVIYSDPSTDNTTQQAQLIRDNWTIYRANNYKYFQTPVSSIKPINKSGAIFFFGQQSPQQILGVDTIRLGSGADATVGTGALFSLPMQNLITADLPYEYGSCQNRLSAINTPMGLFWISQNSGKIFQLLSGITEITLTDEKWWFAQYLPYFLTQSFPNFELQDNPVIGIGCQSIFDNQNTLVYFSKKDYKLKDGFIPVAKGAPINNSPNSVQYTGDNTFLVGGVLPIILGDPVYFDDASWTKSYDPKTKEWVSVHDWKPELCMPGKNTFLTTQTDVNGMGGIWMHNETALLYCNYYGVDQPFEVEFRVTTGQMENTVRNVELQMENYMYAPNEHDRYLMLDYFFDKAVLHNAEQCSGLLKFVPIVYNDPFAELQYPQFTPTSVNVQYSRVENRYRFNQAFDLTDDRGQFSNARRMIWNTQVNGYVRALNPLNLNYSKDVTQMKRIRGYNNLVFLRKDVVGNVKILLILSNLRLLYSPR